MLSLPCSLLSPLSPLLLPFPTSLLPSTLAHKTPLALALRLPFFESKIKVAQPVVYQVAQPVVYQPVVQQVVAPAPVVYATQQPVVQQVAYAADEAGK